MLIHLLAANPPITPTAGDLPGTSTLVDLADGVDYWALVAAVVGVVVGAVMWAFGHYSQNYQQAYAGRRGVVVSALAALLVGAGPEIVGVFFASGVKLR